MRLFSWFTRQAEKGRRTRRMLVFGAIVIGIAGITLASFSAPYVIEADPAQPVNKLTFNAPFTIRFSHLMDKRTVEASFKIIPEIEGSFKWRDGRTLEFHPSDELKIDDEFHVVIGSGARSVWMKSVPFESTLSYRVTGPPYVEFFHPEEGGILDKEGVITVMFDRPMDLANSDPRSLIQSDPELEGEIRIMGSSAFQFLPDEVDSDTSYLMTVPAGIAATEGGETAESFSWSVLTPSLSVVASDPISGAEAVETSKTIRIQMDQAIELDQIKPGVNVLLYPSNDIDAAQLERRDGFFNTEVTYAEDTDGTKLPDTLLFEPTFPFQPDTEYRFILTSAAGLNLEEDFQLTFKTKATEVSEPPEEEIIEDGIHEYLAWDDGKEMTFFVQGEHPRLKLKEKLEEISFLTVCPIPSNEFIRLRAAGSFATYECSDLDPVVLNPFEQDLETTLDLNDYFPLDWLTGVYFVGLETGHERIWKIFFMEDTSLLLKKSPNDLLVWASDVKSGKPIEGMEVEIIAFDGTQIGQGNTDANGIYLAKEAFEEGVYVRAKKTENGENLRWGLVSDQWQNLEKEQVSPKLTSGIFLQVSDKVLNPGDEVHVKGVWRETRDHLLDYPDATQVTLVMEDEFHNFIVDQRVPLRRNGSFDASLKIPESLSGGIYQLIVTDLNHQLLEGPIQLLVQEADPTVQLEWIKADNYHAHGSAPVFLLRAWHDGGLPAAKNKASYKLYRSAYRDEYQEGAIHYSFNRAGDSKNKQPGSRELVARESFEFDENGEARLILTGSDEDFLESGYKYDLEVSAYESDGKQSQIGTGFTIGQGDFKLGLGVKHAIVDQNNPLEVHVIALDAADKAVEDIKVDLAVINPNEGNEEIFEESILTEIRSVTLTVPESADLEDGRYILRASTTDSSKNRIIAEKEIYIVSEGNKPLDDSLMIAADQTKYFAGGRAHLVISSREASAGPVPVLVTYEREGILGYEYLMLEDAITRLTVPIDDKMIPYFKAKVTRLHRGLSPVYSQDEVLVETEKDSNRISIDLAFDPPNPRPGENLSVEVFTYDYQNEPVSSVVTLNALEGEVGRLVNPAGFFYSKSGLVSTSNLSLGLRTPKVEGNTDQEPLFFGNANSVYFNPLITTDEGGRATIEFMLPETAEKITFQSLATRDQEKLGLGEESLRLTRRLAIRPILPRFVVPGDHTVFAASIKNVSDETIQSRIDFISDKVGIQGDSNRNISLKPDQQTEVFFSVVINSDLSEDFLPIQFRSGEDFVKAELPVKHIKSSVDLVDDGLLGDFWSGRIILPKEAIPQSAKLAFSAGSSPMVLAKKYRSFLELFPYESTDLFISRMIASYLDGEDVKAELSTLRKKLKTNGAFSDLKNDSGNPVLTAYALFAYHLTGEPLSEDLTGRSLDYLLGSLDLPSLSLDDQYFILWVLGLYGQLDTSLTLKLYQERAGARPESLAFLLMNIDQLVKAGQRSAAPFVQVLSAELVDLPHETRSMLATATLLYALSVIDPENAALESWVHTLYSESEGGLLKLNPKTALWTQLALVTYSKQLPEKELNYIVQIKVNGETVLDQSVTKQSIDSIFSDSLSGEMLNADAYNDLFVKRDGDGELFLDAHLLLNLNSQEVKRAEEGLLIVRSMRSITGEDGGVVEDDLKKSEQYEIVLEIIVPQEMQHLAVTSPVPSGAKVLKSERALSFPFTRQAVNHSEAVYYADFVPAGVYRISTPIQATLSGLYNLLPATVRPLYDSTRYARTEGEQIQIND